MEPIKGKCIVLGPGGLLLNPNFNGKQNSNKSPSYEMVDLGGGLVQKTPLQDGTFEAKHLIATYDMACEVAKAAAEKNPGRVYHVMFTKQAFAAAVEAAKSVELEFRSTSPTSSSSPPDDYTVGAFSR